MSGGIYPSPDESEDNSTRNPLLCYLCNKILKEPCLLQCCHTFCSQCLAGKASEAKITCPLCGKSTPLKEGASLPPTDPVLNFLVESSEEEWPPCANCDKLVSAQDSGAMFFCNTCSQALCGSCREETHKARMFSKHDIIHMSKRTKDVYKICSFHAEPFIMFSTLKKTMLCINCFRDMSIEGRAQCIDLETAYNQGCKKLDGAVMSIRDLQHSVREGITLFRALLDELRCNTETEKESIHKLCQSLQDTIITTRHSLLDDIQKQYNAKEELFCSQLSSLRTLLPTIHVHLIMCTTFSSSANKHEFLHLGYLLMERLCAIARMTSPLRPTQTSQIKSNFRTELSRNLAPLLCEKTTRKTSGANNSTSVELKPKNFSENSTNFLSAPSLITPPTSPVNFAKKLNHKYKVLDVSGRFSDHCKNFDADYKELTLRFAKVKDQVQDIQRDITLRKCLTKKGKVADTKDECSKLDQDIKKKFGLLESLKCDLEKNWEEQLQKIATEQDIYNAQINDFLALISENKRLCSIITQLEPFIKSITAVVEKISPRLSSSLHKEDRNDVIQALLEQINTIQPDSQQRVDAIQSQEEMRQNKPIGPSLFEESLIQTKGMLKTPMKDGMPIKKDADGTPLRDDINKSLLVGRVMDNPPVKEMNVKDFKDSKEKDIKKGHIFNANKSKKKKK